MFSERKYPRFFVPLNAWKDDGIRFVRLDSHSSKECKVFKSEKAPVYLKDYVGWNRLEMEISCSGGYWKEVSEVEAAFY